MTLGSLCHLDWNCFCIVIKCDQICICCTLRHYAIHVLCFRIDIYIYSPITVVQYRVKDLIFITLVDPGSPPPKGPQSEGPWVEAPGSAPGSNTLISQAVYHHSQLPDSSNISLFR